MRRFFRKGWVRILLGVGAVGFVGLSFLWRSAIKKGRSKPDDPFRVAGNLYYVGSTGITSFLLTGPEGHVLIDGGFPETAPLIMGSIAKLGFKITDVKVLLNTHAHSDHAGGLRELQEASGAKLRVSEGDRELLAVDICSLTLFPFVSLVEPETYPGIRSDFERSFRVLRSLPADVFLASHGDMFGMQRKLGERADARNPADPFIDRAGYLGFIDRAEARFREVLAKQQ